MKKITFITIIMILSLAAMTACTGDNTDTINTDTINTDTINTDTNNQNTTVDTLDNADTVNDMDTETIDADAILDSNLYNDAVSTKDLKKCADIKDSTRSAECKDVVESLVLMAEATVSLEEGICEQIKLERYATACKDDVNKIIKREEENRIQEDEVKNMQTTSQDAIDNNDIELCDTLENQAMYSCRSNVLTNEAIEKNDPTICDKIGDKDFTVECKNSIGL